MDRTLLLRTVAGNGHHVPGIIEVNAGLGQVAARRIAELKRFHEGNAHFNIPSRPPYQGLNAWISKQRARYRLGIIEAEIKNALDSIGLTWKRPDLMWQRRLSELRTFRAKHGHCNVPATQALLYKYCVRVRRCFLGGRLPQDYIKTLEEMGFSWHSTIVKKRAPAASSRKFDFKDRYIQSPGHHPTTISNSGTSISMSPLNGIIRPKRKRERHNKALRGPKIAPIKSVDSSPDAAVRKPKISGRKGKSSTLVGDSFSTTSSGKVELQKLRSENATLRDQCNTLKKTLAILCQPPGEVSG